MTTFHVPASTGRPWAIRSTSEERRIARQVNEKAITADMATPFKDRSVLSLRRSSRFAPSQHRTSVTVFVQFVD
jgi:hypothetical protein